MKERWKWVIGILAIGAILFLGIFFFLGEEEAVAPNEEDQNEILIAGHIVTHTENGVLTLYDVEDEKQTDTFDLKTLTTKTERTVETKSEEDCKCLPVELDKHDEEKPKEEEAVEKKRFKGFEVVEKPVPAGLHVWGVQSKLTPHINTIKMLPLLSDLNGDKPLHPVKPNEKRLFLQELTEKKDSVKVKTEPVKTEVPVVKETPKLIQETIADATYLYHMDKDKETLYAYSDFTNDVYQIQLDDNQLKASVLTTVKPTVVANWFVADQEHIWMTDDKRQAIEVFATDSGKEVAKKTAKGTMDKWFIAGDVLYYVYENRMVMEKLSSEEETDVILGDVTIDFAQVDESFYVLNSFGKKSDNSILLKVNMNNLLVDDIYEIESNQSALIADDGQDTLFVGRINSTDNLNGTKTEVPEVLSFDLTKPYLNMQTMPVDVLFEEHVKGFNDHLYTAKDHRLYVYPVGNASAVSEFAINEDAFSIFAK